MPQLTDTRQRRRDSATTTPDRTTTLDLYVRSLAPRGGNAALETVITRLDDLEIRGS